MICATRSSAWSPPPSIFPTPTSSAWPPSTPCTAGPAAAPTPSGSAPTSRACCGAAYDVLKAFEKELGLKTGQSSTDFSLVEEECIAACANGPAVLCGTKYFLDVTPEQVADIIRELKAHPRPESEVV